MGLFDNLFLDKNTPMAINTGEDHPSDSSQTGTTGDASQSSSSGGNPPQPPIQEEVTNLPPTETKEVSSETTSTPSDGTTFLSDIPTSFDIGGFDVRETANNSVTNNVADSSTPVSSQVTEIVPSQSSDEVSFIVSGNPVSADLIISDNTGSSTLTTDGGIASTEASVSGISVIDSTPVEITAESPASKETILETEETKTTESPLVESPLTTLMSGFGNLTESPSTNQSPDMSSQNPPVDETSSTESTSTDALFSLTDAVSEPALVETTTVPSITDEKKPEEETEKSSISLEEKAASAVQSMSEFGKELARMTRSPRLQGKLTGFISELEELSQEEERLKAEKRKQIESYQIRIEELKKEYETRIHALELEETDLNKQISVMDEERQHITQVIEGFKRELEMV